MTWQQIELESCSSTRLVKSFSLKFFKNFSFGFRFLVEYIMIGVCFAVIWMASSADPMSRYCDSKFYWILGYNMSL